MPLNANPAHSTAAALYARFGEVRDGLTDVARNIADLKTALLDAIGTRPPIQRSSCRGFPANAGDVQVLQPRPKRLGATFFNSKGAGAGNQCLLILADTAGQGAGPSFSGDGSHVLLPDTYISLEQMLPGYDGAVHLYFPAAGDAATRIFVTESY